MISSPACTQFKKYCTSFVYKGPEKFLNGHILNVYSGPLKPSKFLNGKSAPGCTGKKFVRPNIRPDQCNVNGV